MIKLFWSRFRRAGATRQLFAEARYAARPAVTSGTQGDERARTRRHAVPPAIAVARQR